MFVFFIVILSVYLLFVLVTGFITFYIFSHPKTNNFEKEHSELLALGFDTDKYLKTISKNDYICSSIKGYKIHYSIIRCNDSKKTVAIAHGYVGNRLSSLIYVKIFNSLGYNCIIFDQRNHGANKKSFTSMGYYEKKDLKAVVSSALHILGKQETLGILGVSMGAATVLMASSSIDNLNFVISDSSYTSLYQILKYKVAKQNKLYWLGTLWTCNLFLKLFHGYKIKDVSPINAVKTISADLPILFVHSKADRMIPFGMFEKLYNSKKGKKSCFISDTAHHAKIVFAETGAYKKAVAEFLNNSVHKTDK